MRLVRITESRLYPLYEEDTVDDEEDSGSDASVVMASLRAKAKTSKAARDALKKIEERDERKVKSGIKSVKSAGSKDSKGNKLKVDYEVNDKSGKVTLFFTVSGNKKNGTRTYTRTLSNAAAAGGYLDTIATKISEWLSSKKSLYQSMGMLRLKRV